MPAALLIRLRPMGPWRFGAGEAGGNDRVDTLFRSDRLYSAVTSAIRQLGFFDEWLEATARASMPQVAFSSLFPYQGDTLFVPPPRTLWPPPSSLVTAPSPVFLSKIRWDAAQFVPASVIDSLLSGRPILAEHWTPDPESGCLLRRDRPATTPFRITSRNRAAIDRVSAGSIHVDSFACVEFESNAGLWCISRFADSAAHSQWSDRVKAAFRLLADTGFGAGRVIGWGQTAQPEMQEGNWPSLLLPRSTKSSANGGNGSSAAYWLLSAYSPASSDSLDWSGGDYHLVTRSGYNKKAVRMVAEGSVITANAEPSGAAVDVARKDHAHPIYRAGFAVAVRLPEPTQEDIKPVEEPSDIEAPDAKPCPEEQIAPPQQPDPPETEGQLDQSQLGAMSEPIDVAPEPESGLGAMSEAIGISAEDTQKSPEDQENKDEL